jgi:hypothetical protein
MIGSDDGVEVVRPRGFRAFGVSGPKSGRDVLTRSVDKEKQ